MDEKKNYLLSTNYFSFPLLYGKNCITLVKIFKTIFDRTKTKTGKLVEYTKALK